MLEVILVGLLGLAAGSFVNALVWRLHERAGKKKLSKKRKKELSILHGRSMCPDCHHQLAINDLIPVLSWLSFGGKCRYCKKPISWQYPVVELASAGLLVFSWLFWPFEKSGANLFLFAIWAVLFTILLAMAVYDIKWMQLPSKLVYSVGLISAVFVITKLAISGDLAKLLQHIIGALVVGGFFWAIYQISKGKWVGGGDVRLGFVIGGSLGWQSGILAVLLSSYIGTIIIIVLVIIKKYKPKMKLPYGPLLIAATYLCILFGDRLVHFYLKLSGF